jgi:hypothetical protein
LNALPESLYSIAKSHVHNPFFNPTQSCINGQHMLLCSLESLFSQIGPHMTEEIKVRGCQIC